MSGTADPRAILWGLLAVWASVELLFSSHWLPPLTLSRGSVAEADTSLRQLLSRRPDVRVWFAPYTPFPEAGFVESTLRSGVYDTLRAIPSNTGLASNYGASKLTVADTLFSFAAVHGLQAELDLAGRLGFNLIAIDLGALIDGDAGTVLCQRTRHCVLSSDGYALFPLHSGLQVGQLQRRQPLLPWQSSGVTWGPLVFSPFQWSPLPAQQARPLPWAGTAVVQARSLQRLQIYRYPLVDYPAAVQPALHVQDADVLVSLPAGVRMAEVCLGPAGGPCRRVRLDPAWPRLPIGNLLLPGQVSELTLVKLVRQQPGEVSLQLELRAPACGLFSTTSRCTVDP